MYEIINGILQKDGKPVFGLGAAYYASFHEKKMAVPPFGDQFGEMEKDLRQMKSVGLNLVRTSAIGKLTVQDGKFSLESPLADAMMTRLDELDMASMIRIQGYSMKMKAYEGSAMIDEAGKPYDARSWGNFIQDTLHHPEIMADNLAGTKAIAEHFQQHPNLTSFSPTMSRIIPTDTFTTTTRWRLRITANGW